MTDHTRIAELEAMLTETIAYLSSLPLHPATRELTNKAETVLREKYSSVLQAGVRYSYGALIVGAQLSGMTLTLKTESQPFSEEIQRNLEAGLQARFVRGLCLELKHPAGQFKPGFFDVGRKF